MNSCSNDHWVVKLFGMEQQQLERYETYDVAVALGVDLFPKSDAISARTRANTRLARWFWESEKVMHLILSGGRRASIMDRESHEWNGAPKSGPPLADLMFDCLIREAEGAFPRSSKVLMERESKNTKEAAINILEIIRQEGWKSVVLITDTLHAPRAKRIFKKAWSNSGLELTIIPTFALEEQNPDRKLMINALFENLLALPACKLARQF